MQQMVGVGWSQGALSSILIHSGLYLLLQNPIRYTLNLSREKGKVWLWFPLKPPKVLNSLQKGQRNGLTSSLPRVLLLVRTLQKINKNYGLSSTFTASFISLDLKQTPKKSYKFMWMCHQGPLVDVNSLVYVTLWVSLENMCFFSPSCNWRDIRFESFSNNS